MSKVLVLYYSSYGHLEQMADALAYQKGQAVLGMFESWIGNETFRKGVMGYLKAHETQGVTAFAMEVATAFHAFYRDARVVDETEPKRSKSRLALAEATRVTLANALGLLGISAPDQM